MSYYGPVSSTNQEQDCYVAVAGGGNSGNHSGTVDGDGGGGRKRRRGGVGVGASSSELSVYGPVVDGSYADRGRNTGHRDDYRTRYYDDDYSYHAPEGRATHYFDEYGRQYDYTRVDYDRYDRYAEEYDRSYDERRRAATYSHYDDASFYGSRTRYDGGWDRVSDGVDRTSAYAGHYGPGGGSLANYSDSRGRESWRNHGHYGPYGADRGRENEFDDRLDGGRRKRKRGSRSGRGRRGRGGKGGKGGKGGSSTVDVDYYGPSKSDTAEHPSEESADKVQKQDSAEGSPVAIDDASGAESREKNTDSKGDDHLDKEEERKDDSDEEKSNKESGGDEESGGKKNRFPWGDNGNQKGEKNQQENASFDDKKDKSSSLTKEDNHTENKDSAEKEGECHASKEEVHDETHAGEEVEDHTRKEEGHTRKEEDSHTRKEEENHITKEGDFSDQRDKASVET